jgi:WD40 repeat protein
MHDESNAETLLIRANMVCIFKDSLGMSMGGDTDVIERGCLPSTPETNKPAKISARRPALELMVLMSLPPPPAAPTHLLRLHSQPLSALAFSEDNERLYSGDASGQVVVTSTRTLRPIAKWQPHSDSVLGIEEWQDEIVTYVGGSLFPSIPSQQRQLVFFLGSHGRDNKLHIWKRIIELPGSARLGDAAAGLDLPIPDLSYSMDVNALNYCRFSLMFLGSDDNHKRALLAVPGLIDSSVVGDCFKLRHQ